jgi:hypothetical protein
MFGLFKRGSWIPESVAELRGTYRDLHVRVRNMPCLREEKGSRLKYPYPNFGYEFLNQLHDQFGRVDTLATRLKMGTAANAIAAVRSASSRAPQPERYASVWIYRRRHPVVDLALS